MARPEENRRRKRRHGQQRQALAAAAVAVAVVAATTPANARDHDPVRFPDAPTYASSVGWMDSRDFLAELDAMAGELGVPVELPDGWPLDDQGQPIVGGGDDDPCGSAPGENDVSDDEQAAMDTARRQNLVDQFTDGGFESPNMLSALLVYANWTLTIDFEAPATDTRVERLSAFEREHETFSWHAGFLARLTDPEYNNSGLEDASPDSVASMWPEDAADALDSSGHTKAEWLDALAEVMDDIAGEHGANAEYWEGEEQRFNDLGDAQGAAHAKEHAEDERAAQKAAEEKAKRYRELAQAERDKRSEPDAEEDQAEEDTGPADGGTRPDQFGPVTVDDLDFLIDWAPWLAGTKWDADGGKISLIFLLDSDPGADPTIGNPNPAAEPVPIVEHQRLAGGPPPDLVNYLDVSVTGGSGCLEAKLAIVMWDDPENQVPVVRDVPDGDEPVDGGSGPAPTPPVADH